MYLTTNEYLCNLTNTNNSILIHKGFLNCKKNHNEKENCYLVEFRQYEINLENNRRKRKLYLDAFKNDLKTRTYERKFVIDLDRVEQIDSREREKQIYLKREKTNEICLLSSDDIPTLKEWLKILCKNCGFYEFNKIKTSKNIQQLNTNKNQILTNSNQNNNINNKYCKYKLLNNLSTSCDRINKNIIASDHYLHLLNCRPRLEVPIAGNVSTSSKNSKTIAGHASSLVGSFDVNNIFNTLACKKPNKLFTSTFAQNNTKNDMCDYIDLKEMSHNGKENYLQLEECISGVNSDKITCSSKKLRNKSVNDLSIKIRYVPLEVINYQAESSFNSDSPSLLHHDIDLYHHVDTQSKASNLCNFSQNGESIRSKDLYSNDIPYTNLDLERTRALKICINQTE